MKRPTFRPIARVALYGRVSTTEQAHGWSMDSQRDTLSEWAKAEGWEVVAVYADPGASGTSAEGRPQFLQMIEDAGADTFDAVLVLKLDRFARNRGDSAIFRTRLERAGVQLLSYNEKTDGLSRAAALLTTGLPELLAEHYSVELSEKTTAGWKKRAENGLTLGDVPFGYTRDHAHEPIRPIPQEAAAVRMVYEAYGTGRFAMDEVADMLNAAGHQPRSKRRKRQFSKASIDRMITNPVYTGVVTYHDEVLGPGLHEGIVSQALFDRVQAAIAARGRATRGLSRTRKYPYYLAGGLGRCTVCRGPLWANSTRSGFYYRCAARRRGEQCARQDRGVRADRIEASLDTLFQQIELPPDWREYVAEASAAPVAPASSNDRARWRAQIQRAKTGFMAGVLDTAEAAQLKREAEDQLARAVDPTTEAVLDAGEALTSLRDVWPGMTPAERRDAVRAALDVVGVDIATSTILAVQPKPDLAPLFAAISAAGGVLRSCVWRPRAGSGSLNPTSHALELAS